ncbi:alpha/beta hydrolase [Paenibacillus sp. P96]|uniref:Alpha/beta hydrolase n=1 Tax=Paenibacillus zeirhizosphaerae TaxID=2987519 RepID=A0ABT9FKI1_9BACL|nr:alpha/beta hydrolase [Paenibacillus sp. P96]MDP4095236.1 alpha/beta hydrolase [Paenibacillus sp. P96]
MNFDNKVAPELRPILSMIPPMKLPDDLARLRQSRSKSPSQKSDDVLTTSRLISGADGREIPVNIYEPTKKNQDQLPAVLWMHGGGFVFGLSPVDDGLCETLVKTADCVVVSVDYRLAPEHPYPAAIEDCYEALLWMSEASEELNIDLSRLAIAGQSAGGGLTAALSLMARDKGGPAIAFQMPLYPMIDDRHTTPSSYEIADEVPVWNRSHSLAAWNLYLGEHATGDISPYAAPARAQNLAGLPPTYTCVGQLDPFRDETIEYVTRLAQAGVNVEFHLYPGCFHGFDVMVPTAEVSERARNGYINALAEALNPKQE